MSVLALFGSIKSLLKLKSNETRVLTSPFIFTRAVGIFMVVCSIFTTSKQFFGEPIQCVPGGGVPGNVFNTFCYITGTVTNVRKNKTQNLHVGEAHAGVKAFSDDSQIRHSYYQWVPFILFLQGILFYIPYRVWKYCEGGKLGKLLVKVSSDPLTESPLEEQVRGVGQFLARNTGWYTSYASKMFFCQLGILVISVAQMYLLDWVFNGNYFSIGIDADYTWEHYRVVEQIFPLVSTCEMKYIGPAGQPATDSGLCVLAINILNQKIFLIFWYLALILITLTTIKIVVDILLFFVPTLRKLVLRMHARRVPVYALTWVHNNTGYGQFVLLMLIAKNLDGAQFETLINILADSIGPGSTKVEDSIHVSVHSTGKKYNEEYPLTGKQAQSPVITRRPRLMSG